MAAPKKSVAKKSAVSKPPATKPVATTKAATKKPAITKPAAKKPPAKKAAPAKKVPAKKAAAKKTVAKQTLPKKAVAGKPVVSKTAARSGAAKKTAAKSSAPQAPAKRPAPTVRNGPRPSSPDTPAILSNFRPERHDLPAPRGTSKDGIAYTKDFDVKFLKSQREDLLARRASELARATRLEDEASSLIEDGEMGDVQFDDEGGEGDTMVVQRDLDRVLSTQARQTIEEIDAALARIELGTYGYSEVSGLPIPRERLEALPETTVLAAEKVSGIGAR